MTTTLTRQRPAASSVAARRLTGPGDSTPCGGVSLSTDAWAGAAAVQLLRRCEEGLRVAEETADPAQRFCAAHLAAIRAAAAVLAVHGRPRRGSGALNVWEVLPKVAPELQEWAVFYTAGAARRAAIEAGMSTTVSARDADDLCRQTRAFAGVVAEFLGLLNLAQGS